MAFQLTHRDEQSLFALQKLPLTSHQLFRLSRTFSQAFPSERVLRRRMRRLEEEEIVRRFYYAFPSDGRNPAYWRLTRQSYRLINGLTGEHPLPKRSFFSPMGVSLHFHTHRVAEVAVEMLVQANANGIVVEEFAVEKSLAFHADEWITPDATFELLTREGRQYRFFVELDTASERVGTKQRLPSSIQKKLEFYERYRLTNPDPFRVLFVTTSSKQRALNILHFGAGITNNRSAQSIYAAHLPELLASENCLKKNVFFNHRLEPTCLVATRSPRHTRTDVSRRDRIMAELNEREFKPLAPLVPQ